MGYGERQRWAWSVERSSYVGNSGIDDVDKSQRGQESRRLCQHPLWKKSLLKGEWIC